MRHARFAWSHEPVKNGFKYTSFLLSFHLIRMKFNFCWKDSKVTLVIINLSQITFLECTNTKIHKIILVDYIFHEIMRVAVFVSGWKYFEGCNQRSRQVDNSYFPLSTPQYISATEHVIKFGLNRCKWIKERKVRGCLLKWCSFFSTLVLLCNASACCKTYWNIKDA